MVNKSKKSVIITSIGILGFFILLISFLGISNALDTDLNGKSILEIRTTYIPNSTLVGNLSLSLKEGELIPKDSNILISLNEKQYNYTLSQLTAETLINGNYYIEGKSISGSGEGYGKKGIKIEYPNVEFIIKIVNKEKQEKTNSETILDNSSSTNANITPIETTQNDTTNSESLPKESNIENEEISKIQNETNEEKVEKINSEEKSELEITEEKLEESKTTEESNEKNSDTVEVTIESTNIEPITINEIGGLSQSISTNNEYKKENEISGIVSKNKPYTYELNEGQTAEIISSSQPVSIKIENNLLEITTEYEIVNEGFGESYLINNYNLINLDLSSLNILAEEGSLTASIIYNETEIASVSTSLSAEENNKAILLNETIIQNETNLLNETINKTENKINITTNLTESIIKQENILTYKLTEEEIFLIKGETGETEVSIVKSERVNDRLIIRFEIGKYWIEKSYNFESPTNLTKKQIEIDSAKFVKTLANNLLKKQLKNPVEANELLTKYPIEINVSKFEDLNNNVTKSVIESITNEQNESLIILEKNNQTSEENNSKVSEENTLINSS